MIITKFESWWVERGKCLFDERRQGGAKMGWDVIVTVSYTHLDVYKRQASN